MDATTAVDQAWLMRSQPPVVTALGDDYVPSDARQQRWRWVGRLTIRRTRRATGREASPCAAAN